MNAANRENDGENDCQDIVAKCDAQIKNRKTEKQKNRKNRTSREIRQTAQVQSASMLVRLYSCRFHCDCGILALVYGCKARTLHNKYFNVSTFGYCIPLPSASPLAKGGLRGDN
jgi:hypothetical protein